MHYSYIIRVYRQEKKNPRMLVGTVEKVGEKVKSAFTNIDELWEIMNVMTGRKRRSNAVYMIKLKPEGRTGNDGRFSDNYGRPLGPSRHN